MDVVRLDAKTQSNILRDLRASGGSAQRAAVIHFLLAGWDVQPLAAWMGRSAAAIEADWQQFLTHVGLHAYEPLQLDLFPTTKAESTAALYDHD